MAERRTPRGTYLGSTRLTCPVCKRRATIRSYWYSFLDDIEECSRCGASWLCLFERAWPEWLWRLSHG